MKPEAVPSASSARPVSPERAVVDRKRSHDSVAHLLSFDGKNAMPSGNRTQKRGRSTPSGPVRAKREAYASLDTPLKKATPVGDERDAIYLKCEEMVAEKQPWVLISHSKNLLGINPKVKDFYYHPTGVAFFKGVSKEA